MTTGVAQVLSGDWSAFSSSERSSIIGASL
jgi:hypothetical protein